jgi:hypothetical protein
MYTLVEFKKEGSVLKPDGAKEAAKYQRMLESLEEGVKVHAMLEIINDDHSLVQLAKVHALIRELAHCTGNNFEDVKLEVKRKAGLTVKSTDSTGSKIEFVKSFADCSKEQLSMAIQTCIEIGNEYGCILY